MKQTYRKFLAAAVLTSLLAFSSCHSPREAASRYYVSQATGSMITIDSAWDRNPDEKTSKVLNPYKKEIDRMMYEVIGTSAMRMEKEIPESLLSNLVAEVLRDAAAQVLGKPADMGLINMGGLRNILPQGDITVGTVYEILPFENSLCVLTIEGRHLKRLFQSIASLQGEGLSGVRLEISRTGELLNATVGGRPVEDKRLYTVSTVDYLADGNGRMDALLQAEKRQCPENATLRKLFLDYVRKQTADGKAVTSKLDGRISIR